MREYGLFGVGKSNKLMNNTPTNIIYLHGFLGSPQSSAALETAHYFQTYHPTISLLTPHIPPHLETALGLIAELVQQHGPCHFIGTSLGGFLATWAVEKFGGKAVLINPVASPAKLTTNFIGWHENSETQTRFFVDEAALLRLNSITPSKVHPERYWVLLQTADEVLDYRIAQAYYQGCKMQIEEGGSHRFDQYALWLPRIASFLNP